MLRRGGARRGARRCARAAGAEKLPAPRSEPPRAAGTACGRRCLVCRRIRVCKLAPLTPLPAPGLANRYARNVPARGPHGALIFAGGIGVMLVGFSFVISGRHSRA